jgi:hypothetical protein
MREGKNRQWSRRKEREEEERENEEEGPVPFYAHQPRQILQCD